MFLLRLIKCGLILRTRFKAQNYSNMNRHKTLARLAAVLFLTACTALPSSEEAEAPQSVTAAGALRINEIMYDPGSQGTEYVEIVNTADTAVDLADYRICVRKSTGALGALRQLSQTSCPLQAGGYCVLTSDTALLSQSYSLPDYACRLSVKSFPALSNSGATVVITSADSTVTDECAYLPAFHHPLLTDRQGVSLEKLHPMLPSGERESWASASSDAGYATPGTRNSQWRDLTGADSIADGFYLPRKWLCPLNTDTSAYLPVIYHCRHSCNPMARMEILSRGGHTLATLADNALLGADGCFKWYGTDDSGEMLEAGQYLLRALLFDTEGNVQTQRLTVTLLR